MATTKIAKSAIVDGDDDVVSRETLGIGEYLFMEEILPRLPVRHLIRSKLVSKKWNSIISTPEFAKLHLNFCHSNNLNRGIIVDPRIEEFDGKPMDAPFLLLPYTEQHTHINDSLKLHQFVELAKCNWVQMVDSCNGLVCLCQQTVYESDDDVNKLCFFTLWNPATGEHRDIASPEGLNVSEAQGFGYVPCVDDYFIVVASFGTGVFGGDNTFRGLYVFSLKAGKWERILGRFDYLQTPQGNWEWRELRPPSREEGIAAALHGTAVMVGDTMFWYSLNVVGFDVVRKQIRVYPWVIGTFEFPLVKIFRVKGCLSLLFGPRENHSVSRLLMLMDLSEWCSGSSWQEILSVDLTNINLLTFLEMGKCLVRQSDEFKLVDPCNKEALESAKYYDVFCRYDESVAKEHVDSLISPFAITNSHENEDKIEV